MGTKGCGKLPSETKESKTSKSVKELPKNEANDSLTLFAVFL